MIEEVL